MSLRKQRMCDCCGAFTQEKRLCKQCQHVGCERRKAGERCYLVSGTSMRPDLLPLPQIITGLVLSAAGKATAKVEQGIRREARKVGRMIEETEL